MNRKLVFNVMGRLLFALSLLMTLPMAVSIIYREKAALAFLVTAIISLFSGVLLVYLTKGCDKTLYAKEGFLIVSLAWVVTSLLGALPFVLSGDVESYVDAFFETASGFSTTGASVITDLDALSKGVLFWRSFSHWIGGMGVLVFVIAFVSSISDRSIHILRAEMPGPIIGKLTPRAKDTTKVLYVMYLVMTVVQVILLTAGDMNFFDSLLHTFGSAGTGGFAIKNSGLSEYSSYSHWVITVFMFLFGVNFNLYFLLLIKKFKSAVKSSELWVYFFIVVIASSIIAVDIRGLYDTLSVAVKDAFFQVVSIITTTGYATADFDLWPTLSKAILFILMFPGACAGSTAGGLKISRVILLFKLVYKEIKRMVHPRSVTSVEFEGKEVDDNTQRSVTTYLAVYFIFIFAIFFILSFEPFSLETNLSAAVSCFNNVGPGLGGVGPMLNYSAYSDLSKLVLSFAMLFGRLEIFPLLIAMIPSSWRKKS